MGKIIFAIALILSPQAFGQASDIANFYKVGPQLYRGARPGEEGLLMLKSMGVRTVLNLENDKSYSAEEARIAKTLGMNYISIPMSGFWRPKDNQVLMALTVIGSPVNWPVFVHCKRGANQTGVVVGLYRVFTEKWSTAEAWTEMHRLGFKSFMLFMMDYFRDTAAKPNFWPHQD